MWDNIRKVGPMGTQTGSAAALPLVLLARMVRAVLAVESEAPAPGPAGREMATETGMGMGMAEHAQLVRDDSHFWPYS